MRNSLYIVATIEGVATILSPSEDIPIRIDLQTINNGEVGEIIGDLSQSFEFPGTEEHNRFFQNAFTVGAQIVPGSSNSVVVAIENGEQTLFNGTMTLTSYDPVDKIYTCSVQSGIIPLADSLEGVLLADADWSGLDNLTYSMDTWRDQNAMQTLPDYYFPFVDFGYDSDGRTYPPNDVTLRRNTQIVRATRYTGTYTDIFGNDTYDDDYFLNSEFGASGIDPYGDSSQGTIGLISPTSYFGDMSFGQEVQGSIAHPSTPLRIDQLVPAIRLSVVLDKIFEQAGVTYDFIGSDRLNDVYIMPKLLDGLGVFQPDRVVPTNGFRLRGNTGGADITGIDLNGRNSGARNNTSLDRTVYGFGFIDYQGTTFGTVERLFPATAPAYLNDGVFTAQVQGTYEFVFSGSLNNVNSGFNGRTEFTRLQAVIRKNGTPGTDTAYQNGEALASEGLPEIDRDTTIDEERPFEVSVTVNLQVGDVITAALENLRNRGGNNVTGTLVDCVFDTVRTPEEVDGTTFSIGDQFGDLESLQILNGIIAKLNLVPEPDKNRRDHYNIQQYFDWIRNGERKNWSDKVVRGTENLSSLLQAQDKTLIFSGAEGDDRFNAEYADTQGEPYGTRRYTDTSDVTSGERTIGEEFTPLIVANPRTSGDIFNTANPNPFNGIPHIYELDGEETKAIAAGIYIGYAKLMTPPGVFYYSSGTDVSIQYLGRVKTLSNTNDNRTCDLNYSNAGNFSLQTTESAYDKYWGPYADHIYNPRNKQLEVELYFTPDEYKTTNLSDIIHIDGNDYLIKSLSGFNLSSPDTVQAELVTYQGNFESVLTPSTNLFVEDEVESRTFFLGINVNAQNDPLNDGNLIDIEGGLEQDEFYRIFRLAPEDSADPDTGETFDAEEETFTLTITPATRFDVSASNFTSNVNTLTGVSLGPFMDSGSQVTVEVTVTGQTDHVYRNLIITGEVSPELAGNFDYDLTFTLASQVDNAVVATPTLGLRGVEGGGAVAQVFISPSAGHTLDATTFSLTNTLPVGVTLVGFSQLGTSVVGQFQVIFQGTDQTATIEILGADGAVLTGGVNTSTVSFAFTEPIVNVSSIADITFTGVVGTRSSFQIPLYADDGFTLDHDNFSATIPIAATNIQMYDAVGGGESVQIPLLITFPVSDQVVMITLNGSAQVEGEATVDIQVSTIGAPANSTLTETVETFTLNPGQSVNYTNSLVPDNGFQFLGDVTVSELTDPRNSVTGLTAHSNKFTANIGMTITGQNVNSQATIQLGAQVVEEPFLHTLNLSETLPLGKLSTTSFSQRFGEADISLVYSGITISPTTIDHQYADGTTFTVVGGTASNYQYDNGAVSFDVSVVLPTFDATTPIGNVSASVSITGVGEPPLVQASAGTTFSQVSFQIPINTARTITPAVIANGQWRVVSTGNLVSLGVDGTVIASSTTSTMGIASIDIPSTPTAAAAVSIARLESIDGATALSSVTVEFTDFIGEAVADVGITSYNYTITASDAFTTTFTITNGGVSSQVAVPPGTTQTVVSETAPAVFTGGGMGIMIVRGAPVIVAVGGDSATTGGTAIVIGPAGTAPNTLYFTL